MERKRIICPRTGQTEEIDFERTHLGVLIDGCSRFEPRRAVECTGQCAAMMDRLDRRVVDDRVERILVVFMDEQTKSIAESLARYLRRDGLTVELANANARPVPPPADYDAVVIGSRVRFGKHPRSVIEYITSNRAALAETPAFLFSSSTGARRSEPDAGGHIARMTRETGWSPTSSAGFGGGSSLLRWFTGLIGGSTNRDRVTQLRDFADKITEELPALRLEPSMM